MSRWDRAGARLLLAAALGAAVYGAFYTGEDASSPLSAVPAPPSVLDFPAPAARAADGRAAASESPALSQQEQLKDAPASPAQAEDQRWDLIGELGEASIPERGAQARSAEASAAMPGPDAAASSQAARSAAKSTQPSDAAFSNGEVAANRPQARAAGQAGAETAVPAPGASSALSAPAPKDAESSLSSTPESPATRLGPGSAGRPHAGARAGARAIAPQDKGRSDSAARREGLLRKFRPARLSRLLGKGALRPPSPSIAPPRQNPWSNKVPEAADGGPIAAVGPSLPQIEAMTPPSSACRRQSAHWHEEQPGARYYHEGARWGRWGDQRWSWLERTGAGWWIWSGPQDEPLLWHQGHWWLKNDRVWFLLHQGEPWGYRYLAEWRQEGFFHASGVSMLYSRDGGKVALTAAGEGAVLYDAESGEELQRWEQDQLPARPQPRAPSALSLPR